MTNLSDNERIANCVTPVYHETHRYCPSCPWTEEYGKDAPYLASRDLDATTELEMRVARLENERGEDAQIAAIVRKPSEDEKDSIRLAMDAAYDEGTDGTGITNAALAAIIALAEARAKKPR